MKSGFVITSLLSLGMLLAACDKSAPTSTVLPSVEAESPEKIAADAIKRAEKGEAKDQFNLGVMYEEGKGVPKDVAKAIELYQKAAAHGYAQAMDKLGQMYAYGRGLPQDSPKAIELYQKAAEQGFAEAYSHLASMYLYFSDQGVPEDRAKAFELYQKAAALGVVSAYLRLSEHYFYGQGVPKDAAKALEWSQKGAALGDADAQLFLGIIYSFGGEGVPKNEFKAIELFQKAAAQGAEGAYFHLGVMYEEGKGVPKDVAKAIELYQKAAAQGYARAMDKLAQMYTNGEGVPKDSVLAYAWYNLLQASRERDRLERRMSAAEIAEAQRLSSAWKEGQIFVREGKHATTSTPSTSGSLSKQGTGTAFLVSNIGYAITNHHIVTGCGELRVEGRNGLAKVVTDDKVNDLALLQIPDEAKASAPITTDPGKLRQGEDIVVFGFPLNPVLSSGGNLTPGVVSALTGLGNNTNQIQITAPIQPGSSGSPVLNKKGEVVGVVSMKLSDLRMAKATGSVGQNVNFAVNGQTLRTFLDIHKVAYRSGAGFFSREKSTADLADEARKWTLVVECWK